MAGRYRGLRFLPTDDELFFHYLMPRLRGEPLPDPNVVRDYDVYGGGDPWKIFGKDWDEKSYVFTMLKKKSKSRVDRTAGSGTWKGEQNYKIKGSQGEVIGYKKLFTFEPKANSSEEANKADNGHWIMYEFSKHPHNDTECVLCVISNKYAEEASKKARRNLHSRVQLEEESRRAKKARPHRDDRTNANDVPSVASPPSTTATARAQPSTSPPFNEDEVVIRQNICGSTSPDFAGDAILNSHPAATTTMAVPEDIRCTADFPAFGGANAGTFSTTSTAVPSPYREWAKQLKNVEISPLVKHRFCTVLKDRARALHARNNLFELNTGGVPANLPDIRRIDELHLLNCNYY
ncbi:NAC domain-containing protein 2-like [Rhodamnia argentea]|uniref:NAC domain-containing protein 2-like n=1 Tax=Rhodamnia argentea TaxID=178133 RepID=A0ABM3H4V7_9MYRT|nr:NAC domain-containing protein 2-like [Rhodamnia argentea]